jgi:serine protease SohB
MLDCKIRGILDPDPVNTFLIDYGLFLAKLLTLALVGLGAVAVAMGLRGRARAAPEQLEVTDLNRRYDRMRASLERAFIPHGARRRFERALRSEERRRAPPERARLYVLDFQGDIRARGVESLREEITAVLTVARPGQDEVLVRVENAGGLVHEHGLAASQLVRLREHGLRLTVAVDKVAASGGYLMACVGERILAAPFAILGSIGVIAQLPNFHRWLDEQGIDFEQFKAGEHKRTVTMFGVNTEEDRAKLQEQIEQTHALFKDFVARYRPALDLAQVATGEYWYGTQALQRGLIDELITSDDYLLAARERANIYAVRYPQRKGLRARLAVMAREALALR